MRVSRTPHPTGTMQRKWLRSGHVAHPPYEKEGKKKGGKSSSGCCCCAGDVCHAQSQSAGLSCSRRWQNYVWTRLWRTREGKVYLNVIRTYVHTIGVARRVTSLLYCSCNWQRRKIVSKAGALLARSRLYCSMGGGRWRPVGPIQEPYEAGVRRGREGRRGPKKEKKEKERGKKGSGKCP